MTENFISWEEYQAICNGHGETDPQAQRDLARFLHILGIALHYADDPRLYDTRVLKPTWVTDGIYTLLRAGQREQTGGVLRPSDLGRVLDPQHYPPARHDFLLRLMEKFQLCFRLPGPDERYLVPELLDENQPDIAALLASPGLGFRYQYEVLPEGLLPRFIVQTHRHSEPQRSLALQSRVPGSGFPGSGEPGYTASAWRWRTGVVLEREKCLAVVRADLRERRVDIHITGFARQRRDLLAIIREKFDEQHRELKGLKVDERVPIPGEPDVTVSFQDLLKREARGETTFYPENVDRPVPVLGLLNGLTDPAVRQIGQPKRAGNADDREPHQSEKETKPMSQPAMKSVFHVFLSHNSKDKPAVRDVKSRLVEQGLTVWFDEDELQPGVPWQELLEFGIRSSASVAVLVGKDGLGPWEDEEMQGALRLAVKEKRPVIPVLLPGAGSEPELPMFLSNRTWVDLRDGVTDAGLAKLVWGITGKKPNPR